MALYVITGANRGIGLEWCRQVAARGDEVVAVCRQASPDLAALNVEVVTGVDLLQPDTLQHLVQAVGKRNVDVLINNAGVWHSSKLGEVDYAGMTTCFEVNTLGPLRVTEALLSNLRAGSKIGVVSSRMGSIEDNTSGGTYAYRVSKTAVNAVAKSLAIDLAPQDIAVAILHPGWVATDMTEYRGPVSPETAVNGMEQVMASLTMKTSGQFFHANGAVLPW